jgi:hypothetical protein
MQTVRVVAVAPAIVPAAAPASRSRVGASPRTAQSAAMNPGIESNAMLNGQLRQV